MTLVVYEALDSMSGSIQKEQGQAIVKEVRRRYVVGQCDSFDDCVEKIEAYTPMYAASVNNYWMRHTLSINGLGNKYFDVTATYRTLVPVQQSQGEPPEYVPGSIGWDTTGHSEHITQSLPTQQRIPNNAPNYRGAINVSGDAVQGIDVVRPVFRYSETWILPVDSVLNCAYLGNVYRLTGTVNANQFRCFEPGEALFLGARGQWQEDQPYVAVTYEFEARPNDPNYYPFDGAAGFFDKKGWDHIWIKYQDEADEGELVKVPVAAYKSKVYREESWSALGISDQLIGQAVSGLTPLIGAAAGNAGIAP